MSTMMMCGHRAHGVSGDKPACVICYPDPRSIEVDAEGPNLSGRVSRCHCGKTEPSSIDLAFFEFKGENSPAARQHCNACGYYESAHKIDHPATRHKFTAHGTYDFDSYYCGCDGWD